MGWDDQECSPKGAHTSMDLDAFAFPTFSGDDALRDIAGTVGSQDVGALLGCVCAWIGRGGKQQTRMRRVSFFLSSTFWKAGAPSHQSLILEPLPSPQHTYRRGVAARRPALVAGAAARRRRSRARPGQGRVCRRRQQQRVRCCLCLHACFDVLLICLPHASVTGR